MKITSLWNWQGVGRPLIAEFLGTFVFVFLSCGVVLSDLYFGKIGSLGIAFASAGVLVGVTLAIVHLSQGHLNPAVTLALWLAAKIKGTMAAGYMTAQLAGAVAAAYLLLGLFGEQAKAFSLGGPILGADISVQTAVIVETLLSAILIFTYFATMVDRRGPVSFGPLALGLVWMALTIFALPISGAGINVARAIPLLVSGNYEGVAVWFVGPVAGSLIGLVYEFLFERKLTKSR